MGMEFRMVLYATGADWARTAAEAAFTRVEQLNLRLSDYEEESELNRLNRMAGSGHWVPVSIDLWRVMTAAQEMAIRTGGAFDVTVGPVVQLWRRARRQRELPPLERLTQASRAVGYTAVELDANRRAIRLQRPGMRLDLGGIAKGYILDEVRAVLRREGVSRALLQAGGDLAVGEAPPHRPWWRIELAQMVTTHTNAEESVKLRHAALATSGDLFQYLEIEGIRYSHIVDPRSGQALTNHGLVFVIAPRAMTADAWSTALSVLGPKEGMPLLERSAQKVAARIFSLGREGLEVWESRKWRGYVLGTGRGPGFPSKPRT
ncbi:MAG: FAD:protein FMN transferase [Verrucomicrobiota bacterium]|nr:FAD:protein FMN transferase [Limisphaera sp.]MDW8380977.1 FAD:protein FMN transferase [Verrucomicrobiota bacterium]